MQAEYAAIRSGLRSFRRPRFVKRVFGARRHRFQPHSPLSEEVVQEFESRHRISLPEEYRGFLIHVGNGGAGPGFGLFRLGELNSQVTREPASDCIGSVGELSVPFPYTSYWNPTTIRPRPDRRWRRESEQHAPPEPADSRCGLDGAFPICYYGCTHVVWLVVSGAERGNIWYDGRPCDHGIHPYWVDGRDRTTFLPWYHEWMEEVRKEISSNH